MLLLTETLYHSRGTTSPVTQKPEENPPRKNSSDIWRSDAAQYGHEPCSERALRLGAMPTPKLAWGDARYCRLPKSSVCCVVASDHPVMLNRNFGSWKKPVSQTIVRCQVSELTVFTCRVRPR